MYRSERPYDDQHSPEFNVMQACFHEADRERPYRAFRSAIWTAMLRQGVYQRCWLTLGAGR